MAPGKERILARISAIGSSPAMEVLAKRFTRGNDMPSFGTKNPISEAILRISRGSLLEVNEVSVDRKPEDKISMSLLEQGVDQKANVLFDIIRMLSSEAETLPFQADHKGIFMGETKIGLVMGSASDSPIMVVWVDWLFQRRASNYQLLDKLPLSVIANKFNIGEIAPFVNRLASSRYSAITADKFMVQLKLFEAKTGPELGSFNIKWTGSPYNFF